MASAKAIQRAQKFKKLREAGVFKHADDRDYHTGKESKFYVANGDSQDGRTQVPLGPQFKTPQWVRTVRD